MLLLTKYTVLYKENEICCIILPSLPSRERGLKSEHLPEHLPEHLVAPFAGAWIEIHTNELLDRIDEVAPFAGAWIEIRLCPYFEEWQLTSLPSRERGLKYLFPKILHPHT